MAAGVDNKPEGESVGYAVGDEEAGLVLRAQSATEATITRLRPSKFYTMVLVNVCLVAVVLYQNLELKRTSALLDGIQYQHLEHKLAHTHTHSQENASKFVGPWKMTIASPDPRAAGRFIVKYFGAEFWKRMSPNKRDAGGRCVLLDWSLFTPLHYEKQLPWLVQRFQLHFVKQWHRPTGRLSIEAYEAKFNDLLGNNAVSDNRVIFRAPVLDAVASRLGQDHVPFFTRNHGDGTSSVIVHIPATTYSIEVVGPTPTLTVVEAQRWGRCDRSLPKAHTETKKAHTSILQQISAAPELTPIGFSYPSTQPAASAAFLMRYFGGRENFPSPARTFGHGDCAVSASLSWRSTADANSMEVIWTNQLERAPQLAELEQYTDALHGNFTVRSANHWNHYMDYHMGFVMENCDDVVAELDADGIEYFWIHHARIFTALMVKDSTGIVYEFACLRPSKSAPAGKVENWNFCKHEEAGEVAMERGVLLGSQ